MRPNQQHNSVLIAPPPLDLSAHALFLDLDGTLAPIAARPQDARVGADLRALLQRLAAAMNGALAIITGRTIEDADRLLAGAVADIAGVHGHEIRRAGALAVAEADLSRVAAARETARSLLVATPRGALMEDKSASIAFHYRHAPEAEQDVREIAEAIALRHGLRLLEGKMVIELIAGARTKADAIDAFLAHPPYAGRTPVVVGDDVTDEDAFMRARALGGLAVLVGAVRESAAEARLADPEAVAAWLAESLRA